MVSLAEKPLTGEPDAGDPPVRFGGGDGATRHPYPIPAPDRVVGTSSPGSTAPQPPRQVS
jgi:hypothetical protein